jgi:hypothetical protein
MARPQNYERDKNGSRFDVQGMNTVLSPDILPPSKYPYLQNVRRYLQGRVTSRNLLTDAALSLGAAITSLRRLNDTTPLGPSAGYAIVAGAGKSLYVNSTAVATGMSGNPMSFVPFRPNASVQPWMYVADGNKMLKVNANGTCFLDGVEEPQTAPSVTSANAIVNGSVTVPSTTQPWLQTGTNVTNYPFTAAGGTNPVIIACLPGSSIMLTATGTITTSYGSEGPGGFGPTASGSPGFNVAGSFCNVLMGGFTDSSGNVVTPVTGTGPVTIGAGPTTLLVPAGAVQLQLGIDDTAYVAGTSFTVSYTLTTQAASSKVSIVGQVTAYFWGDSPTSGPVANYVWNNPSDPHASANPRTISTAIGSNTNTSFIFDDPTGGNENTPMTWTTLDSTGAIVGSKSVFASPLSDSSTNNFANFNMCVVGTLYIPAAGAYTFQLQSKDNTMWGIGGGATWAGKGTIRGAAGQSITVVNKSDLLPSPPISGEGNPTSVNVSVTFPAAGDYSIELDYDYWYHNNRSLVLFCFQPDGTTAIVPLPVTVLQNVQYRYVYRSSATGATSNPSPESTPNASPVQTSEITPVYSTDPQVDKVDYYRMDDGLDNFTYVGTGPNTTPPTAFVDEQTDIEVSNNQILQFDNFQPFPVIDQPHKGVINVTAGVATWVSGQQFNVRWLAGTIINSGGIDYVLDTRPTSATTLTATEIADGTNLTYEIDEPLLAAQPMPAMWGPTDNAAYMFACGDTINPGTLYYTKGNNPDSAPDTNQMNVTSPSEPLMSGCIVNGIGMVFSTERAWLIYPNFTNAAATVAGVTGSPFSLIESITNRGLYIRTAIAVDGGQTVAFRGKDGIYVSPGGTGSKSITDEDIYNLFPHEGSAPQAITLAGYTVYPPDDTRQNVQQLHFANGYLYYDYQDSTGTPRTLVFDMAGGGWSVDVYQHPATIHVLEEGPNVNTTLVGCSDGTIRTLSSAGTETASSVLLTPCMNVGDARANKTLGDIFLKGTIATAAPVAIAPYKTRFTSALTGYAPTSLTGTSTLKQYIIDFTNGFARYIDDIELVLSWPSNPANILELWQPDFTDLPENTQDRPTDWDDNGMPGMGYWQGLILEADTFGQPKVIAVQDSDTRTLHVPDQSPLTFTGQTKQALTFTPPFLAHSVRIVTTDGVPWQYFGQKWVSLPFPEMVVEWQTQFTNHGMNGWLMMQPVMNISHISSADLTVTLVFDQNPGGAITLTVPNSGGLQIKTKITVPVCKFKLVSYRVSSTQPFFLFADQCEVGIGMWGRGESFTTVKPFGGPDEASAFV